MKHSFQVELAKHFGLNKALLIDHILYWQEYNSKVNRNYNDGAYWIYHTIKEFHELFPYLSEKQISKALEDLVEDGLLITGNYNKISYDRTKWYSITEKGYSLYKNLLNIELENVEKALYNKENSNITKGKMENYEMSNGIVQNVNTIPTSDTTSNTTSKTTSKNKEKFDFSFVNENIRAEFIAFVDFRKILKKAWKTQNAIQKEYQNLMVLCNGNYNIAKLIIQQSIDKEWLTFFQLKNKPSEPQTQNTHTYDRNFSKMTREEYLSDIRKS